MNYGIIIPNRYQDIIQPLVKSFHEFIPKPWPRIIVIANGHQTDYGLGERIDYPKGRFVFSRAINLGINALEDKDVVLLNDDTVILEQGFFKKLHDLAYKYENVGVLSPLIRGCVGSVAQRWHNRYRSWKVDEEFKIVHLENVCFPCVYIKRQLIDQIGLLSEAFTSYGGEDEEFCIRTRMAPFDRNRMWRTAVTSALVVKHGDGSADLQSGRGRSWSVSYARLDKKFDKRVV